MQFARTIAISTHVRSAPRNGRRRKDCPAGLYGAFAVRFFAPVFGGTCSQTSGPTAPMTVAMAAVLTSQADILTEALTVVVPADVPAHRTVGTLDEARRAARDKFASAGR